MATKICYYRNKIESIDIADTSSNPEEKLNKRNSSEKNASNVITPDQQEQSINIS